MICKNSKTFITMKKLLLAIIIFFGTQVVHSQTLSYVGKAETVDYDKAEVKPEYLGGYNEFIKYISENFKAPEVEGLSGVLKLTFIIEVNGRITGIKVVNDLGSGTAEEAIRVLKACPIWSPGEVDGERVRVKMELPITIRN
jgi:hypothetical protein